MPAARTDNLRGAALMTACMAGFSSNDACMKSLADLPMGQSVFLRGLVATLLLAILAWRADVLGFRPGRRDRRLIGLRIAAEIAGTVCFLLALFHLPLAVTLGAALFLGEPVGWRRCLAIGAGFLGALFGEVPDAATLVGSAIVVATGIFTLWRERKGARIVAGASTAAGRAA